MPASKPFGIDAQIKGEVHKALKSLGAGPNQLSLIASGKNLPQGELYGMFAGLGAKSDLLSIIGSWGDTMDDEWVLESLRDWNRRVPPISGRRVV